MKVGEIFVEFGLKGQEKMKDFSKDLASLPLSIVGTLAAFGGLSLSVGGLIEDMIGMTKGLREFNAETGLGTDALEKWEQVGRRVGLTNDQVQASFNSLVTGLTKLRTVGDESMVQWFARMGINDFMSATPEQLIAEMRARYQAQKSPAAKQNFVSFMRNLGIDPALALAFQSPLSSPQSMARMNPIYGKGGQDTAAQFIQALSELTDAMRREWVPIFREMLPYFKEISKDLSQAVDWILHTKIDPGKSMWNMGRKVREWMDQVESGAGIGPIPNHLFLPGKLGPQGIPHVSVNQHFYGDVDKFDIDAGVLDLKSTLTHTMRMLGKEGR